MKEAKKRKLMLGAGALTIIGLIWYASAGAAQSENQRGTVGGGYSPFITTETTTTEPSQTGEGTSYSVQFPTVTIPPMPTYTDPDPVLPSPDPSPDASTKKSQNYIPANIPGNDTGKSYSMTVMGPAVMGPAKTESDLNTPESRAAYSAVVASGIPGGSSTKKGAAVGQETAPGGLPGLIGGLVGGIGGLFGW